MCRIQCYLEPACWTFNFCEKQGNFVCELTNSDHIRHDLIEKAGCTYHGSENHCSSNPCPKNATCQGEFLSDPVPYKCICPAGYGGDNCFQDINECNDGTHTCHSDATCNNTIGGFNCTCKSGFNGNGKHCEDIDECESGKHNCHVNATCTNSLGGFNCSCKQGHFGNGTHCYPDFGRRVIFDFEDGKKTGWSLTGTAFNNQPTYKDNSKARGKPSNLQGNWWIGSYENGPSPSHTYGSTQGDGPRGTMTSPPFVVHGSQLKFRIGGGCTMQQQRAELLIGGTVVAQTKGPCSEYMVTKSWSIEQFRGQTARVRLVDNHNGGWGHINFDYLEEYQ
ncbi:fibrillin-2-like [Actinia tenebrosa]|uniref:Fibrillin-2-like n=1 Tax=Actinia tenebrosa TaxID=6105 RepID=A0A6P8HNH1_ACTTE|nr:fibrillin-2-like [Actinia tenebrosa]